MIYAILWEIQTLTITIPGNGLGKFESVYYYELEHMWMHTTEFLSVQIAIWNYDFDWILRDCKMFVEHNIFTYSMFIQEVSWINTPKQSPSTYSYILQNLIRWRFQRSSTQPTNNYILARKHADFMLPLNPHNKWRLLFDMQYFSCYGASIMQLAVLLCVAVNKMERMMGSSQTNYFSEL